MTETKRDLSIPMAPANVIVMFISIPVVILQFAGFVLLHGTAALKPTWSAAPLILAVLLGIVIHELIHGLSWVIFGHKSFSSVQFGFQWKTLTPYAHLTEPVEVNAYRLGAFMPGFILGIFTYVLSLVLGNGDLFWFSLIHTSAAGGDWLVLWLIRHVKPGRQVEDHPTNAGCYVVES
jgi:Putative zincin peptidase